MQLQQLSYGEQMRRLLEGTYRRTRASLARQTACMHCAAGATTALAPLMKVLQPYDALLSTFMLSSVLHCGAGILLHERECFEKVNDIQVRPG